MVSGKNVTAAVWPFWMFGSFLDAFCCVPPLYLPINQPRAYYANRPRAIFQRPIAPRKRQEEHNKGEKNAHKRKFIHYKNLDTKSVVPDVLRHAGKEVNTRGSDALLT